MDFGDNPNQQGTLERITEELSAKFMKALDYAPLILSPLISLYFSMLAAESIKNSGLDNLKEDALVYSTLAAASLTWFVVALKRYYNRRT